MRKITRSEVVARPRLGDGVGECVDGIRKIHARLVAPSAAFGSKRPMSKTCTPMAQLCFSTVSRVRVAAISFHLTRAFHERNNVPWS